MNIRPLPLSAKSRLWCLAVGMSGRPGSKPKRDYFDGVWLLRDEVQTKRNERRERDFSLRWKLSGFEFERAAGARDRQELRAPGKTLASAPNSLAGVSLSTTRPGLTSSRPGPFSGEPKSIFQTAFE